MNKRGSNEPPQSPSAYARCFKLSNSAVFVAVVGLQRWDMTWDYPRIYSWQLGAEINRPYYAARAGTFADWDRAKHVCLFPSPFDDRSKVVPAGNGTTLMSTAMLEHFLAYVHGAAFNMSLPL